MVIVDPKKNESNAGLYNILSIRQLLAHSFFQSTINQLIKQSNKFSTWPAYIYEHNIRIDNPEWGYLVTFYTGRLRPKVQPYYIPFLAEKGTPFVHSIERYYSFVLPFYAVTLLGFTLEAKLVSSKHLIQVHLEILSRSEENMASHLLKKSIT